MRKLKYLFSVLFCFSGLFSSHGQAPVAFETSLDESLNQNISRIDSLTRLFYQKNQLSSFDQAVLNRELNSEIQDGINPENPFEKIQSSTLFVNPETYNTRIKLLESPINLEYNEYVQNYLDLYGGRKRELTSRMLTASKYYFPVFEEVLDKNNLPLEFKYLSIVESALNPHAVSHCGATGLWQFMYYTGKMYDLNINNYVDDRKDLMKSTQAACDYFKNMYAIYNDWLLVIASYNCGPGNVNKAIKKSGGKTNFWEIQKFLPAETRGYVPAFIAVTYLMNYSKEHGIYPAPEVNTKPFLAHINVSDQFSIHQLASFLNLPVENLLDANPSFKKGIVPHPGNEPHKFYMPYEEAMRFIPLKDSFFLIAEPVVVNKSTREYTEPRSSRPQTNRPGAVTYTVRKGDILSNIAKKNQCTVAELKSWNNLKSNTLRTGQTLTIRKTAQKTTAEAGSGPVKKQELVKGGQTIVHEVKSGETLYGISKKYPGTTVNTIIETNNISENSTLKPGTLLKIRING